jgi:predicted  nucleic acid-binding Zn-ribbon protein
MLKIAATCLGLLAIAPGLLAAQDIAGIEDCTKAAGLDKRTGCLQSNVNVLQQMLTKSALDTRQRLTAASNEIAALKSEVVTLKSEIVALKTLAASLQKSVEQLQAAQKAASEKANEKKPESK